MTKRMSSIQFLGDKVIVEFEKGQVFQFCKACKDGKHFKAFINYFSPQINLQLMDQALATFFEKRFFYCLSRGPARRVVKREAHEFSAFIEKRFAWEARKKERAENKKARIERELMEG